MKQRILTTVLLSFVVFADAQVKLPRLISNGMVLQRETKLKIWGWSSPQETVKITFKGSTWKTKADKEGSWNLVLPGQSAGGPFTMKINGRNEITISDILIGDVWLCSGQSNMVHQLNIHDVTYAAEIAHADYPQIRQFTVPAIARMDKPGQDYSAGAWIRAVKEEVRPFSAVAYFFAKQLYEQYHIPIGLINASVGGTPIEAWISEEGLQPFPEWQTIIQKNKDTAYINRMARLNHPPNSGRQPQDKGMSESPAWFEPGYLPRGWRSINVPGYWEDQGVKNLDGVVWYRKEIEIPASMTGKPAKVFLGRIVDADVVYINGQQIGHTSYQYPQRRYPVPAGLLQQGKNTIVIRITNNNGKGGFVPDKPYCLFAGNDTVDLKGNWQYKAGAVYDRKKSTAAAAGGGINAQNQPAALYNGMIAPLTQYALKGFIWYQGESNTDNAEAYSRLQPAQIYDWRSRWQNEKLPFLYVQLPGFMDYDYLPAESNWAQLRQAQLKSLSVPNTGMAVAIDLGEWNDIHPDNKKDVGLRLALLARSIAYGEQLVAGGPLFSAASAEGNKITIAFTNTGSGLTTSDGMPPGEFAVAGADKKFVWADAIIEADKIVVTSGEVPNPVYVRYAWADNPVQANLYNKEGLPASPFEATIKR